MSAVSVISRNRSQQLQVIAVVVNIFILINLNDFIFCLNDNALRICVVDKISVRCILVFLKTQLRQEHAQQLFSAIFLAVAIGFPNGFVFSILFDSYFTISYSLFNTSRHIVGVLHNAAVVSSCNRTMNTVFFQRLNCACVKYLIHYPAVTADYAADVRAAADIAGIIRCG